jgi:hypothetical protein
MQSGIRFSSVVLLSALLLSLCMFSSAQQIRFEDFTITNAMQYLQLNGSANLNTYNGNNVLRLTDGGNDNPEVSTVYFQNVVRARGSGKQPVAGGFTTWFEFQMHYPTQCCMPGDGFAFIVQNNGSTDPSYGARGSGLTAVGAGNGGMGYAGISNNLAIEFDILQNPWDPIPNHIAVQTCGPNTNTPVHLPGDYTIGNNHDVTSCLYGSAIYDLPQGMQLGGTCNGSSCTDGAIHQVFIQYTAPTGDQLTGTLAVWLDNINMATHTPLPGATPVISVPYDIVYNAESNPLGLNLDPGGLAWVGFTASQPNDGTAQDILGWEFTPSGPVMLQKLIQPGGTPTVFAFGAHQTTVTYPVGFTNPSGTLMTVVATPTDRNQFYQMRLLGTQFANEQCVAYSGLGTGASTPPTPPGTCVVYSYTCQDSMGNPVTCPTEPLCTSPQGTQCIAVNTSFYTTDNVTPTNADYLENDAVGDNNWMSIFTMYMNNPIDGTTSGGTRGFGSIMPPGAKGRPSPKGSKVLAGDVASADIVATFKPSQP